MRDFFDELRIACVLTAAFDEFLVTVPATVARDSPSLRHLFFDRWRALPDDLKSACVLATLVQSPLCQDTAEVRRWRAVRAVHDRRAAARRN